MGKASRDKGRRGEQEVARICRARGFPVDRVPNSGGLKEKGDLKGLPLVHAEVKHQETLKLPAWSRQSEEEARDGQIPAVIYRRSREPWRVSIPLDDFLALLKAAAE